MHVNSLSAKCQDVIAGTGFPAVAPAVFDIGFDVGDGTGAERGNRFADGDFERAFVDDDHFFVNVLVGRVRGEARAEFGFVHFHAETGVGFAVEDGTGFILAVAAGADGEVFVRVGLGGESGALRADLQGGEEEGEVAAVHGF